MKPQFQRGLLFAVFMCTSFAVLSSANAASACKGLEQSVCQTTENCGWVNSYSRKDGREVKAFCRTKAKKSVTKSVEKEAAKQAVAKTN